MLCPPCYPQAMRVFVAASLILAGFSGWAEPELRAAQTSQVEKPDILARIGEGKTIHINCMGTGSPTVILTAGLGRLGMAEGSAASSPSDESVLLGQIRLGL